MELCYNLQTCSETSTLEQDLALCAKTGFQFVELDFAKAQEYLRRRSMRELSALFANSGIRCAAINAIFDISFCTPERWKRCRDQLDFACELGAASGANRVIVLTSECSALPGNPTDKDIFDDTVDVLSRLADRGANAGMKIALEPVGTMAVGSIRFAWDIIQKIDRPEVGLVMDDFNLFLWDLCADLDDIRLIRPEKIFIAHLNDAEKLPFARINQIHRCMPGDGRIDVARYVDNLHAAGYDGLLSVEVLNPSIWAKGPETVIPEAYAKARKFVI